MSEPLSENKKKKHTGTKRSSCTEVISFRDEYLKAFSRDIVSFLKTKIESGEIPVHVSSRFLGSPDSIKVNNSSVRNVIFSRKSQTEFYSDIIVSTLIEFREKIAGETYTDTAAAWYRIRTESCLDPREMSLNDVVFVIPYEKNTPLPGLILDNCLVPYVGGQLLEDEARGILSEYYPEALDGREKTDGAVLAERMGLNLMYVKLSEDSSVCGRFFFENMPLSEAGVKTGKLDIMIPADTVAVDPVACMDRYGIVSRERLNSAIIHECVHSVRHRLFHLGQRYFRGAPAPLSLSDSTMDSAIRLAGALDRKSVDECLDIQNESENTSERTPVDWIEWQTDRITPRTYMPEDVIRKTAEERKKELRKKFPYVSEEFIARRIIYGLAEEYGVSLLYAKNRLVELGYEEARGVMNYADGKYVKDYVSSGDTLAPNQTYTVSVRTLCSVYSSNQEFRELLGTGAYVYADGHVCLNQRKYVISRKGEIWLTEYAKRHMSECCLVFTLTGALTNSEYTYGILGKLADQQAAVTGFTGEKGKDYLDEARRLSSILFSLPASPTGTLKYHMQRKKMTVESLVSQSGISERSIERLREEDGYRPGLSYAIAVCIGLHLEPRLSHDYLRKLGIMLTNNTEDVMYDIILTTLYKKSVRYVNSVLNRNGLPSLTRGTDELE